MKKKIISLMLVGTIMLGSCILSGCDDLTNTDDKVEMAQEELLKEAHSQVELPNIKNFYEKKLAKKIFELRDNSELVTYAYTQNMDGKYVYLGTCVGYGLPYSVQYTNPEKYEYNGATLPQADPNGLFMPTGLSATWLILVDETTGEQSIIYAEPNIVVTQSKLPKRLVAEWSLPNNY